MNEQAAWRDERPSTSTDTDDVPRRRRPLMRSLWRYIFPVVVLLWAVVLQWGHADEATSVTTASHGRDGEGPIEPLGAGSERTSGERAANSTDDDVDVAVREAVPSTAFVTTPSTLYDPDVYSEVTYNYGALRCRRDVVGVTCNTDYYPSEIEGLTTARIGYEEYVCRDSFQGSECFRWYGIGSPKDATFGLPDLYCNRSGECSPDGYPDGW